MICQKLYPKPKKQHFLWTTNLAFTGQLDLWNYAENSHILCEVSGGILKLQNISVFDKSYVDKWLYYPETEYGGKVLQKEVIQSRHPAFLR